MSAHRFLSAKNGNISMFFAFSLIPVIGMIGFAVDYTRASNAKDKMASALDAAALNANRLATLSLTEKTKIAKDVIAAQLQDAPWIKYDPANITVTDSSGLLDVKMNGQVKTSFVAMLGIGEMQVSAAAQSINRIEDGAEIALVLDNTGSMRNDMTTLKSSVTSFINAVMPVAAGQVKIGIVPYVASVNPGPAAMAGLMDYQANATHHAQLFENWAYVSSAPCEYPKNDDDGGGGGDDGWDPPKFDPGKGGNEGGGASAGNWLDRFASLVAIGSAEAAPPVTPNTKPPFVTTPATRSPPFVVSPVTVQVPQGFVFGEGWQGDCALWNPPKISHFDLFDRIPGAKWKGCVEARREPFDVQDDAPTNTNADTLFVPYFWPDEPDGARNDFMRDYPKTDPLEPLGFHPMHWIGRQDVVQSILKYNGSDNDGKIDIDEVAPDTLGPNKGCPDPIVPLTADTTTLANAVANLNYNDAGGTINAEGLMWGWRVLSPGAPFTEGAAYGSVKKYLVLMSDGKNEFTENNIDGNVMYSDYTAYGYLAQYETRLSMGTEGIWQGDKVRTFEEGAAYLDERFLKACANVKAAGVTIFTVLFREDDANAKSLMQACASESDYAYYASNSAALVGVFGQLAQKLQNLRLTK